MIYYLCLEKHEFMLYTAVYEYSEQVFFTAIGGDFRHADADFNRAVMDDADYVHDEILVKVRH